MADPAVCWLVPDDLGGGVISVAEGCCEHAADAGMRATLLLLLAPTGHMPEAEGFRIESLDCRPPYDDAPERIVSWLRNNPQQVLYLNGCEQADVAIPYVPAGVRCVYVVHDTAERYYLPALRHENQLDAIVAVSETVASPFRDRLRDPHKLSIIHNGTTFPADLDEVLQSTRADDLIFLGGENPVKGAYDAQQVWRCLQAAGFMGRLHWFGSLSTAFADELRGLPGSANLVLHGRMPRSAVFRTAMSCKVMLMLSRVEPFGMATIECMGMGCTPVAWDIETGTKEIARPGEGHFVALGDVDALAQSVLQACRSHGAVFAASTRRIRAEFDERVMGAKYVALSRHLLSSPAVARASAGERPPAYRPRRRFFQLLPEGTRSAIRRYVGRSARLGYWLRDYRGY